MKAQHRSDSSKRHHFSSAQYSAIPFHAQLCYAGWLKKSVGWHEQPHSHSFFEALLITGGSGFITANGRSYFVTKGDAVLYNPGVTHFERSGQTDPMSVLFFAVKKFCLPELPNNCLPLKNGNAVLKTNVEFKSLRSLVQQAVAELEQKPPLYAQISKTLINAAMLKLWRLAVPEGVNPKTDPVLQAISFIDAHFSEPLNLNSLAKACSVSKYHLSHLFTSQKGQTVGEYLLARRLLAAKSLLETQDYPVHEVARLTGFQNSGYFCRVFKGQCGLSPLQYRKNHAASLQSILLSSTEAQIAEQNRFN